MRIPLALVATVALAAASPAQRPSSWAFDPQVGLSASSVDALGKIAWRSSGVTVSAFSSATRGWASWVSPGSFTARLSNDWLMVDAGTTIAAFSAARGVFETIAVSANKTVVNPNSNRNDALLAIHDGNTLWTFSGLTGGWSSRAIATNAAIVVERNVLIVVDGPNLLGYSATQNTWASATAAAPASTYGVSHTLGWAIAGNVIHGYSAIQGRWASVASSQPAANATANGDVVLFSSPVELVGFSGISGAFGVLLTPAATLALRTSDHVGYASPDGVLHYLFGAVASQWTVFVSSQPATATVSGAIVLLTEPPQLHAYSGLRGTVATTPLPNATTAIADSVAAAVDAGNTALHLFSAVRGTWHLAPQGAQITLPELARTGALLTDGAMDWWGFSSRFCTFELHVSGASPTRWASTESSIVAVESDTALACFDARRNAWIEMPLSPAERPVDIRIWRTCLVAHFPQSGRLVGFGAGNGEFESAPLQGTFVSLRANSEVGAAVTTDGAFGYAPLSDLGSEVQFPEFRRLTSLGATFTLRLVGEASSAFGIVAGIASPTDTRIAGLGALHLSPALLIAFPPGVVGAGARASSAVSIPVDPALRGIDVGFQALVLPPAGTPYLTQLATVLVP